MARAATAALLMAVLAASQPVVAQVRAGAPVLVEPELLLRPLKLTEAEIGDLVAFLESLTEKPQRRPVPRRARVLPVAARDGIS